jgi:hypothetical protein
MVAMLHQLELLNYLVLSSMEQYEYAQSDLAKSPDEVSKRNRVYLII